MASKKKPAEPMGVEPIRTPDMLEWADGGEIIIPIPSAPQIYTAIDKYNVPPKKYRMVWLEVVDLGELMTGEDDGEHPDDVAAEAEFYAKYGTQPKQPTLFD